MRFPVLLFLRTAVPAQILTRVSTPNPVPAGCDSVQHGTHYPNSAVEPWVVSDPNNPQHLVGVWQQDRWSDGESSGLLTASRPAIESARLHAQVDGTTESHSGFCGRIEACGTMPL
jgi:hypothetical protein